VGANMVLTLQELEVLRLLARGWDVNDIAEELSIPSAMVRDQVLNAQRKLGAKTPLHAVAEALRRQLIA
jgi:DNA-binding NarL/FixJ family response regulator